nr:alpha/beta hydrolase [Nocardioides panaciterrulae]
MLERAQATRDALDLGRTATDLNTGKPVVTQLLLYLPGAFGGDGAGAVSFGDPDTATDTAVLVPGLTNDLSSIASQGQDALHLFQNASNHHETTAVIAWMGYDAPSWDPQRLFDVPGDGLDVGGVTREDLAEDGGHRLSDFVDGLRVTDQGGRSHLTVIGHSYGSTTAAHAAHDGLHADSLTLIGSPGAGGGVHDVSGLHMPAGHVYVGSADNDVVTWLGRDGSLGMGQDPAQAGFGATRFAVDPGPSFHADDLGQGIRNHTSYFDDPSTSLDNLGSIVAGDQPTVVEGRHEPANDLARNWAEREAAYQAQQAYHHYADPVADHLVEAGEHALDGAVAAGQAAYETGHDVLVGGAHLITDPVGSFQDLWR